MIIAYQNADLVLLNGAGYAQWVDRASLPASRTIDTGASRSEQWITEDDVAHTHGPGDEHVHRATAFTTWLDLTFAVDQARAITSALSSARPQLTEQFEANFAALDTELSALDERWQAIVAAHPEQPVLASHPVYQYLARRTGLSLESLHWEPDEVPDDIQWRKLQALHAEHPAKWMLWEGEPLPDVVERLKTIGVECVVFDPCGNTPGDGTDFIGVMQANTSALETVFGRN
jgi:zinc transport system substrate-binding protein